MEREGDWFVTNGRKVVGPVSMGLLLQGVARGDVDDSCSVWRQPWGDWRSVAFVREVQGLRRAQTSRGTGWAPDRAWRPAPPAAWALSKAEAWICGAEDEAEAVTFTMQAAVNELRATVGSSHRPRGALRGLHTSAAVGPGSFERLGREVDPRDPAMTAARTGIRLLDAGAGGRVVDAMLGRFGDLEEVGELRGLALVPVYSGTGLLAIVELGKVGQPFRRDDHAWLREVVRKTAATLVRIRSGHPE